MPEEEGFHECLEEKVFKLEKFRGYDNVTERLKSEHPELSGRNLDELSSNLDMTVSLENFDGSFCISIDFLSLNYGLGLMEFDNEEDARKEYNVFLDVIEKKGYIVDFTSVDGFDFVLLKAYKNSEKIVDGNCVRCGECCFNVGHIDITDEDTARWEKAGRKDLWNHYMMDEWDSFEDHCQFLKYVDGQACCEIENIKPNVCRNYKPGSNMCPDILKS